MVPLMIRLWGLQLGVAKFLCKTLVIWFSMTPQNLTNLLCACAHLRISDYKVEIVAVWLAHYFKSLLMLVSKTKRFKPSKVKSHTTKNSWSPKIRLVNFRRWGPCSATCWDHYRDLKYLYLVVIKTAAVNAMIKRD